MGPPGSPEPPGPDLVVLQNPWTEQLELKWLNPAGTGSRSSVSWLTGLWCLRSPMMLLCGMSVQLWCLSFRPPYGGLVLDGVKTVESRWRPLLAPLENQTLAVHIAWRDWEGEEWRTVLRGAWGMSAGGIQELLDSGERFGRGAVAGLVDVGRTWLCAASTPEAALGELERAAVLIGLQDKHLTHLSNPRWLREPLKTRGGRDLWTVEIPAELLP
ncbi:LOW QUALITY PROTEIN: protein EOLA1 [Anableps anableps]